MDKDFHLKLSPEVQQKLIDNFEDFNRGRVVFKKGCYSCGRVGGRKKKFVGLFLAGLYVTKMMVCQNCFKLLTIEQPGLWTRTDLLTERNYLTIQEETRRIQSGGFRAYIQDTNEALFEYGLRLETRSGMIVVKKFKK